MLDKVYTSLLPLSEFQLETMVNMYPYFSEAQIVLAKKYFDNKHVAFTNQLHIASLHAKNRKELYNFIHQDLIIDDNIIKDIVKDIVVSETSKIELAEVLLITKVSQSEILTVDVELEKEDIVNLSNVINPTFIKDDKIKLLPTAENAANIDIVKEDLILQNIISNPTIEKSNVDLDSLLVKNIDSELPVIENDLIINLKDTSKEEQDAIYEGSFLQWLLVKNYQNKSNNTSLKSIEAPLNEVNTNTENRDNLKERKNKIVEKFIINQPRITPGKVKFYSPAENARQSVIENEDLVSETLVLIYVKQGNYKKALKSLDKLILKYPEKSTYFANQIKKIKEYTLKNNIK